MDKRKPSGHGFSLVEICAVVVIIAILATLTVWRVSEAKQNAETAHANDILDTVQKLEQLAIVNQLSITNTTALPRLLEIQQKLADRGSIVAALDPTNATAVLSFDGSKWTVSP